MRAITNGTLIIAVLTMLIANSFISDVYGSEFAQNVSIIKLIATPNKYHNKKVRVIGFARIEFEGTSLYLSQVDTEHSIYENALWLDLDRDQMQRYKSMNKKWMIVEGTFDAKKMGHGHMFSGSIEDITRFEEWRMYDK